MANEKCIVDNFGGSKHPYGYCIKPLEEMIDYDKIRRESGSSNMVGIEEGTAGIVNYATALVSDPRNALAEECKGMLGNKYVLKSQMKCKNMDENVHSYINNVVENNVLTGRKDNTLGIIPATIGSALSINGAPLIRAMYEDPNQNCIKVTLPCHMIFSKKPENNYTGPVNDVPISVADYDRLIDTDDINPTAEQKAFRENIRREAETETYANLHETIYGYLNENPQLLNKNTDVDDPDDNQITEEKVDDDDDVLSNLYYLMLSIFLLYLIFKLMSKK
jgi:hypothetical protein|tara:strand:- start:7771 stop:8604 length:834 start_codon:yes stop_codon:yes gene_type:complete